jgi:hypothetical protein
MLPLVRLLWSLISALIGDDDWYSPPAGAPNHEVHVPPEQLPVYQY